jgi:Secretion system C-terminal sorting domain
MPAGSDLFPDLLHLSMKKTLSCLFLWLLLISASAQRTNHWYFGDHLSLDFTSGSPVVTTGSAMYALEGAVSYSDLSGNLMFYSNGGPHGFTPAGIWNRNHQLMPNGDFSATSGCWSSVQSGLVVPDPAATNRYYLFTVDCLEHGLIGGLRFNVIDMTLDNGFGDLVVKDSLVEDSVYEGMTGIIDAQGTGYWLVCHKTGGGQFVSFHITSSGISAPVYSASLAPTNAPVNAGTIRISSDGTRLCWTWLSGAHLYTFNASTGIVTSPIDLQVQGWGCCFSPNCNYLYTAASGGGDELYQFDLNASNIPASAQLINSGIFFGLMQNGPDGKMYLPGAANNLWVINNPDSPGLACGFAPSLSFSSTTNYGLPNFLENEVGDCSLSPKGLDETEEIGMIRLFPNPANDQFQLFVPSAGYHFSIVDVNGRLLMEKRPLQVGNNTLDISTIASGIYLVRIEDAVQTVKVLRLVVD